MNKNLLITLEDKGYNYSSIFEYMADKGFVLHWEPLSQPKPEELIEKAKGFAAVIAGLEKWNREVLQALKDTLKIIARYGIGYDSVDLETASTFGIAVTNTPGTMSGAVAELALGLMIDLSRKISFFDVKMKSGQWWQKYTGSQLGGKTVGIVGFGKIGKALAGYLQGFKCRIIAYDPEFDQQAANKTGVSFAELDTLARESDYISLHLPKTQKTSGLIDSGFLALMKPGAYLINTSRGGVVVEKDLVQALKNRTIAGAALDVFEVEPPDRNNPLLNLDNVILTPHIASATYEGSREAGICACDNILDYFSGRTPRNLLNRDLLHL